MAIRQVLTTNTFEEQRQIINAISSDLGDFTTLSGISASSLTDAFNSFISGQIPLPNTIFTTITAGTANITQKAVLAVGTPSNPSITFQGDLNTGIYSNDNDHISISTGGVERFRFDSIGGLRSNSLGSASSPVYSFIDDSNTGIYSPTSDTIAISTGGTEKIRIDSSGRLGIGVTPSYTLDIVGSNTSAKIGKIQILDDSPFLTGGNIVSSSTFALGTTSSNPVVAFTNNLERFRIDSSGNIGVGTSNPETLLDCLGTTTTQIRVRRSGQADVRLIADTGIGTVGTYSNDSFTISTNSIERVRITSSGTLNFVGSGTPGTTQTVSLDGSAPINSLVLDSSGKIGIGTNSPTRSLDINGSVRIQSADGVRIQSTTSVDLRTDNSGTILDAYTASSSIRFQTQSLERVRIDSSGNVGIGTSNPGRLLHLNVAAGNGFATITGSSSSILGYLLGDVDADAQGQIIYNNIVDALYFVSNNGERLRLNSIGQIQISNTGSASAPALTWLNDSNTGIYSPDLDHIAISTDGTGRLFVTPSGNVGIGTSNADNLLTVNGTASFVQIFANNSTGLSKQSLVSTGSGLSWDYAGGQVFELDDISNYCDGLTNTFTLTYLGQPILVESPYNLLISVNGKLQPAYNYTKPDYVWQNNLLCVNKGYTIDDVGNLVFAQTLPNYPEVIIKRISGVANNDCTVYPFNALDIVY